MSDDVAIRFKHVSKMYKVFGSKLETALDALNLPSFRRGDRYREFWALRDIDLEVPQQGRLGIIGRNGAGKSTLLKLVTGNLLPTEGEVTVDGNVQALLEIGGGLHPEFTGRENIRASLGYFGLTRSEIEDAEAEVASFTELGRFLDQPFRTYSQGMQARLSFAVATVVQPEILIVDEILGAGDAYFFARSTERMQRMIDGGATVLLVSHALDQVVRFCEESIWIDRGRIVMRGSSIEVVKAYERFSRELDAKRLLATNRKSTSGQFDGFERDSYTDSILVDLRRPPGGLDISEVSLHRDGALEDAVAVGDAQDADPAQSATVVADEAWSHPQRDGETYFRSVTGGSGAIEFRLWFFYASSQYTLDIRYRSPSGPARGEAHRPGTPSHEFELPTSADWTTYRLDLSRSEEEADGDRAGSQRRDVSRWPGEGSLVIDEVRLEDGEGNECALFTVGAPMQLRLHAVAKKSGKHRVIPAVVIYRRDGIQVSSHIGPPVELQLADEEGVAFELDFGPLNLGDGPYVISVALYRTLSQLEGAEAYDLIDRSYGFEVTGNAPFNTGVFTHPGSWQVVDEARGREDAVGASGAEMG